MMILLADDDGDDRLLASEALVESGIAGELHVFEDGEDLLEHLRQSQAEGSSNPSIILLDLNMPKLSGKQVLETLRADATFKHIPVIILTTSQAQHDIDDLYDAGAHSYIIKPASFDGLVKLMQGLWAYWSRVTKVADLQQAAKGAP
jgi:two-component system response regulator